MRKACSAEKAPIGAIFPGRVPHSLAGHGETLPERRRCKRASCWYCPTRHNHPSLWGKNHPSLWALKIRSLIPTPIGWRKTEAFNPPFLPWDAQSPLPSSLVNAAPSFIYSANICGRRRNLTNTEHLSRLGSVLGLSRQQRTNRCAHRTRILEPRNRHQCVNK